MATALVPVGGFLPRTRTGGAMEGGHCALRGGGHLALQVSFMVYLKRSIDSLETLERGVSDRTSLENISGVG